MVFSFSYLFLICCFETLSDIIQGVGCHRCALPFFNYAYFYPKPLFSKVVLDSTFLGVIDTPFFEGFFLKSRFDRFCQEV